MRYKTQNASGFPASAEQDAFSEYRTDRGNFLLHQLKCCLSEVMMYR